MFPAPRAAGAAFKPRVLILGAGPIGAATAMYLSRLRDAAGTAMEVHVVEKRADLRVGSADAGRSINLVLTSRGLCMLRRLGLQEAALGLAVPVQGRCIHPQDPHAPLVKQPYGINPLEANYAVSRTGINALLIDEAEKAGATFHFSADTASLDCRTGACTFAAPHGGGDKAADIAPDAFDFVIAADGIGSVGRNALIAALNADAPGTAEAHLAPLGVSYKELHFPSIRPEGTSEETYCMDASLLHIWPRGSQFLMTLADRSHPTFTGTMYVPDGAAAINVGGGRMETTPNIAATLEGNRDALAAYVHDMYPDVPTLVPDYLDQFLAPGLRFSRLQTLRTSHWAYGGTVCCIGDAAHGIVPFFGQGMNAGLESALVLCAALERRFTAAGSLGASQSEVRAATRGAFERFVTYHKPSATAIADMAIENYTEMAALVADEAFQSLRSVERALEAKYPTRLRSRYYMVTKTLVPYATVQDAGRRIDRCLQQVVAQLHAAHAANPSAFQLTAEGLGRAVVDTAILPEAAVVAAIDEHVTPFYAEHGIDVGAPLKEYYPTDL
jgi:kynurenine 3-monooxygenase